MLVYLALDAIAWVLVAAFFAIALNPAVEALVQRGLGRARAAAIVFVVAFAALAGLGALVIPPLVSATTSFVERFRVTCVNSTPGRPAAFLEQRFHLGERLVEIYEKGGIAALVGLERPGASTARAAVDTALALVAVPFLTFFMLLDGKRWVDGALDVLPPGARPRWERVCDGNLPNRRRIRDRQPPDQPPRRSRGRGHAHGGGRAVRASAGRDRGDPRPRPARRRDRGTSSCAAAALSQGVLECVIVVIVLIVYQQLENHVLLPVVYGRAVDLSPLGVLVAILIGASSRESSGVRRISGGRAPSRWSRELVRWRRETSVHLPTAVEDGLRHTDP